MDGRKRSPFWKYAAAAALFVVGSFTLYYASQNGEGKKAPLAYHNDVLPGGDKAILTLADGSTITLDNSADGKLATQGDISIEKDAKGQIVYLVKGSAEEETQKSTFWQHQQAGSLVWFYLTAVKYGLTPHHPSNFQ